MNAIKTAALLAIAAASIAATSASAQTIAYSSYNGANKHAQLGPESVGTAGDHLGYLPPGYIALAAEFVPTVTGTLDHFDMALGVSTGLAAATVTLVPDNGSGAPNLTGPVLETIVVQKLPVDKGSKTKSTVVRSTATPTLTAGMTYWIILTTAAYDGSLSWFQSNTVDQRVIFTADGGQTFSGYTSHQAAFDVWLNTGS
jgi:hypothetical protein